MIIWTSVHDCHMIIWTSVHDCHMIIWTSVHDCHMIIWTVLHVMTLLPQAENRLRGRRQHYDALEFFGGGAGGCGFGAM